MIIFRYRFITALFLFISCDLIGQEHTTSEGIYFTFFNQSFGSTELSVDYEYMSISLEYSRSSTLIDKSYFGLIWEVNPQVGYTSINDPMNNIINRHGIEVGALLGLSLEFSFFPRIWSVYAGGSIGPQFISQAPKRQKNGFIFSDNAFIGSKIRLNQKVMIDLRAGIRHQSNASLGQPNGGINSLFIKSGILFQSHQF